MRCLTCPLVDAHGDPLVYCGLRREHSRGSRPGAGGYACFNDFFTRALVGGDARLAARFDDGQFATLYLSPKDYHRTHMPCDGRLVRMTYVPGQLFSVNPTTTRGVPGLFARNERVVCVFDSARGPFVLTLVGATIVGIIATVWHGVVNSPRLAPAREWQYDEMAAYFLAPLLSCWSRRICCTFAPTGCRRAPSAWVRPWPCFQRQQRLRSELTRIGRAKCVSSFAGKWQNFIKNMAVAHVFIAYSAALLEHVLRNHRRVLVGNLGLDIVAEAVGHPQEYGAGLFQVIRGRLR